MKTRILSAVVGIIVLIAILFCPFVWAVPAMAGLLAMIAVWELLNNTGLVSQKWLTICGMLFAGAEVLTVSCAEYLYAAAPACGWLPVILPVMYAVLIGITMVDERIGVKPAVGAKILMYTLYGTVGFVALARLRLMQHGIAYVLLPMVISWMSDTGAYFSGYFFGKHKMAPIISPKKTWEGFFGGLIVSVGCSALFGAVCHWIASTPLEVTPLQMAVLAIPLAPLSVCGDLLASKIKRQYGIKDYGNIMPGHGGVMDRFDSVVFIAPLLWLLLWLFV